MAREHEGKERKGGTMTKTIIPITAFVLFVFFPIQIFSGEAEFEYDELNRLEKAIYDDGLVITYTYDKAGNRLQKKIEYLPPVRIERTTSTYDTLQAAYNSAQDEDVIQLLGITFADSLIANRAITVTLEGGYDIDWQTNTGGLSTIKGSIRADNGTVKTSNTGSIRLKQ